MVRHSAAATRHGAAALRCYGVAVAVAVAVGVAGIMLVAVAVGAARTRKLHAPLVAWIPETRARNCRASTPDGKRERYVGRHETEREDVHKPVRQNVQD